MSAPQQPVGSIGWIDLTIADAVTVRDFYQAVVGWTVQPLTMKDPAGDYEDFVMQVPSDGRGVTGICHARGSNAGQPAVWLPYVIVVNLDDSMAACTSRGGKVLNGPRNMGKARYCVIEDPAGAKLALYDPGPAEE
ncbi:MAG: VOC family protein [Acidobacteria bacterium]|nr:VOC family protein [Acidobacteriota bacterium]